MFADKFSSCNDLLLSHLLAQKACVDAISPHESALELLIDQVRGAHGSVVRPHSGGLFLGLGGLCGGIDQEVTQ